MAQSKFRQARLAGVVTAVPREIRRIDEELSLFGGNAGQIARLKSTIGLHERRVADRSVTALDLGEAAARRLAAARPRDPAPDALLFVTQTPDHFQPGNAAILHGRLGLPDTCAALDLNLGCAGYVYGCWVACALLESGAAQRVWLLTGDTLARCAHPRDRATAALFGDAGSATLLETADSETPSWYSLHTEGRSAGVIRMPAGAFRQPPGPDTMIESTDLDGNVRTPSHLHMDGAEVFNFSLRVAPRVVQEVLTASGWPAAAVDHFLFHQANRYILQNVARRLQIPLEKVPADLVERYGNQSSASVPAALCQRLGPVRDRPGQRSVLCGFGVGLSWAACATTLGPLDPCEIMEVTTDPAEANSNSPPTHRENP